MFRGERAMLCKSVRPEYAGSVSINPDIFHICCAKRIQYVLLQGLDKNVVLTIEDFHDLVKDRDTIPTGSGDEIWVINWSELDEKYAPDFDIYNPETELRRKPRSEPEPEPKPKPELEPEPEQFAKAGWMALRLGMVHPEEYLSERLDVSLQNSKMGTLLSALRSRRCNLIIDAERNCFWIRHY
jgi:hypothetical protein